MRESFTEEPRRLLSWLSNHIRSPRRSQSIHHSHSRRKETASQASLPAEDLDSPPSIKWAPFPFSTPPAKPSPSFPNFTILPSELRLQIWEYALFTTPRVVKFIEFLNITEPDPSNISDFRHLLLSTPIPSSLQVCHETREIALKRYIFTTGNIRLYLNPEIDTLYFGKLSFSTYSTLQIFACCAKIEDLRRLKRLVVDETFLNVMGSDVQNDSGPESIEDPAFKILSGLQELILVHLPEEGKSRGMSSLGPIFFEDHCPTCRELDWWVGMDGWIFPTYRQFVDAERCGVEDVISERAYQRVLEMRLSERSSWLWEFVNRRMSSVCKPEFDVKQHKIRACSVAGLHRFVDILAEDGKRARMK